MCACTRKSITNTINKSVQRNICNYTEDCHVFLNDNNNNNQTKKNSYKISHMVAAGSFEAQIMVAKLNTVVSNAPHGVSFGTG